MSIAARELGRTTRRQIRLFASIALALFATGCKKPPKVIDLARVDVCVLIGADVSAGCATAIDSTPLLDFKDVAQPQSASLVVDIYDGGGGNVGATISDVTLGPSSDPHVGSYALALFTLDASNNEVSASLPLTLKPGDKSGLRVRVTFDTTSFPTAAGNVSGVSLSIVASHPENEIIIPIVANITGCASGWGDCDSDTANGCETPLNTTTNCGACAPGGTCGPHASASCVDTGGGVMGCPCDPGWYDENGVLADGCECQADLLNNGSCDASYNVGTLTLGQSVSVPANIVPSTESDWYTVTFTQPSVSTAASYDLRITLNPETAAAGMLVMDVADDCSGTAPPACSDGGSNTAVTQWEFINSYYTTRNWEHDDLDPRPPSTVYVRVYAIGTPAKADSCLNYSLTLQN